MKKSSTLMFLLFISQLIFGQDEKKMDSLPNAGFQGGIRVLKNIVQSRINYPERALEKGVSGTVIVRATILPNGEMADATVSHSENLYLDKEAIRIVKSLGGFIPAVQNGFKVKSSLQIPVEFNLPKSGTHINMQLAASHLDAYVPLFPGGLDSLKMLLLNKIHYPSAAYQQKINGDVLVSFNIDALGKLINTKVISQSSNGFDAPILAALQQMPTWETGQNSDFGLSYSTYIMYVKFRIIGSNNEMVNSVHKFYEQIPESYKKNSELFQFVPIADEFTLNGLPYLTDFTKVNMYGIDRESADVTEEELLEGKDILKEEKFVSSLPNQAAIQKAIEVNKSRGISINVNRVRNQKGKQNIEAFPGGTENMKLALETILSDENIIDNEEDLHRVTLAVKMNQLAEILSADAIQGKFSYLETYTLQATKKLKDYIKNEKKNKANISVYYITVEHNPVYNSLSRKQD